MKEQAEYLATSHEHDSDLALESGLDTDLPVFVSLLFRHLFKVGNLEMSEAEERSCLVQRLQDNVALGSLGVLHGSLIDREQTREVDLFKLIGKK